MKSVRFDPNLEAKIERAARLLGKPVSALIREAVETRCNEILSDETLDKALADVIGSVAGSGEYSARDAERTLGEILDEKRRSGHL